MIRNKTMIDSLGLVPDLGITTVVTYGPAYLR